MSTKNPQPSMRGFERGKRVLENHHYCPFDLTTSFMPQRRLRELRRKLNMNDQGNEHKVPRAISQAS